MVATDDHALSLRLPRELYETLRRFAFEHRISQAEVIREALMRFFEKESE